MNSDPTATAFEERKKPSEETLFRQKTVFISHKSKDKEAAKAIKKLFDNWGGGKLLNVFISERIEAGQVWSKEVFDHLDKADYLILLYTDPSEEWDWCLFEAGFYAGRANEDKTYLVCLHSTQHSPPKPLQQWQSIGLQDLDSLMCFLAKLFQDVSDPIATDETKRRQLAMDIIDVLQKTTVRRVSKTWNTKFITITLGPDEIQSLSCGGEIPDTGLCGKYEDENLSIFGHQNDQCTLLDLLKDGIAEKHRSLWLNELGKALRAASLKLHPIPLIPILYSKVHKAEYYVLLSRYDRFSDGSMTFYLLFIEKPREDETIEISIQLIGDMLKLGRDFRWKILTQAKRDIKDLIFKPDEEEITVTLEELLQKIDWIRGESNRLGLRNPDDIVEAFSSKQDREKMSELVTNRWPAAFQDLTASIESRKLESILHCLEAMLELNKDYMLMAAKRYHQLLARNL
ncbi:MAG: toll/interleukin-1 receptor domain-containing protein [Desulfovermiculus sp.]